MSELIARKAVHPITRGNYRIVRDGVEVASVDIRFGAHLRESGLIMCP